ncbi:MAG TPA: hypothetical protein P5239_07235 [Victivallales bacterium]|nr:hypothetical protein [Victivallales bacterium]
MPEIISLRKKQIFLSDSGEGIFCGKTKNCEFVKLTINPRSKIPKHTLDFPVNFFIISGNPLLISGTNKFKLQAGDIINLAPGEEREWENSSNSYAELLVIKEI